MRIIHSSPRPFRFLDSLRRWPVTFSPYSSTECYAPRLEHSSINPDRHPAVAKMRHPETKTTVATASSKTAAFHSAAQP